MSGTSTSQFKYTGVDAFAASAAAALMAIQPANATLSPPIVQSTCHHAAVTKIERRSWVDAQISAIEALPANWDGYGADPISGKVTAKMRALLAGAIKATTIPGSIVPGADGSLQAEWHIEKASLGLLVEHSGRVSSWVRPQESAEIEQYGIGGLQLFQSAVLTFLS